MSYSLEALSALLQEYPSAYYSWWTRLYRDSPTHVIIETTLIVAMLYILLVKRTYDPSKRGYGARRVVELTEREEEELLQEWQPDSLVPKGGLPRPPHDFIVAEFLAQGRQVLVRVAGGDTRPKVTWCSQDFLGNGSAPEVRVAATETLKQYTVGSCGPRGFYGTTLPHLELEDALASFMGTAESITYSDSTATTASAIPAFAKRGDMLLVDAGAAFGVQLGARLSRSKTVYFRHNDMGDLQRHLQRVRDRDESVVDDSLQQRRFIVVEGLYAHYGDLCPLPEVLRLAREYKWRVILDDSCGIGVLGATGRGAVEHYGLSTSDVDVLIGSLATSLASVGGFCLGSREVVDHQRLSGAGYCFSASAPPFTCATATASLQRLLRQPSLLTALRDRCVAMHSALCSRVPGFIVTSDAISPVKHLLLKVGPAGHYPRAVTEDMLMHASGGGRRSGAGGTPAVAGLRSHGGEGGTAAKLGAAHAEDALLGRHGGASAGSLGGGSHGTPRPENFGSQGARPESTGPLVLTSPALLALRREEDELLRAIVLRAAAAGSLVTRSHYLDTECTAPRPTLKFYITLAHTEAECEALLRALVSAATEVLGGKQALPGVGGAASGSSGRPSSEARGPLTSAYRDKLASPVRGSPPASAGGVEVAPAAAAAPASARRAEGGGRGAAGGQVRGSSRARR